MLLANFTTVRPEMGRQFCPCKTPLIAGNPSKANSLDEGQSAAMTQFI